MSYAARLQAALAEPDRMLLYRIAAMATRLSVPLYLVGGPVRDCLLGGKIVDFDLTTEGDAIALAQSLAREFNGDLKTHDRFGTAKVILPERAIDLAMTRTETYAYPGALPDVARGTIATDLIRRDFTINAMALRLDGDYFGELVDGHGGQRDLENKLIRVLHDRSFHDDPTRLFRAARFEQRFDFAVEADTLKLIPSALPVIDQVSGDRLRHELELLFREARPDKPLARLAEWGVLRQIDRDFVWDDWTQSHFQSRTAPFERFTGWAWLLARRSPEALTRIVERLNLSRDDALDLGQINELLNAQPWIAQLERSSAVYRELVRYHDRALQTAMTLVDEDRARRNIDRFLGQLRQVKVTIDGAQLQALGLKPGPALGQVLDALRDAKLDGIISTPQQEAALARELIRREMEANEQT